MAMLNEAVDNSGEQHFPTFFAMGLKDFLSDYIQFNLNRRIVSIISVNTFKETFGTAPF
jgi:hypothetical protein